LYPLAHPREEGGPQKLSRMKYVGKPLVATALGTAAAPRYIRTTANLRLRIGTVIDQIALEELNQPADCESDFVQLTRST
jgi:hypothetical protein